jgi:hypothetical protein
MCPATGKTAPALRNRLLVAESGIQDAMTDTAWTLQVFKLSDRAPDELIARIVRSVDGLVVRRASDDGQHLLIVESGHSGEAEIVEKLVMALDEQAELMHMYRGD